MAWTGNDIPNPEEITFRLSAEHIAALKEILARVSEAGLELGQITKKHTLHPALDKDLAKVFAEIQDGRGIVIVRGFPVEGYTVDQICKMLWIAGAHFGTGLTQSARGDLLGLVKDETPPGQTQSARGYLSRRELSLHTDLTQIMGLMCVRQAKEGGMSPYVSGLAIHNDILANRPDVLPILYRGFPYSRRGEEPEGQDPITPYNVPVFSNVDGIVSVFMVREVINVAFRDLNRQFTKEEEEALNVFREAAERLGFQTRLEPGDVAFVNNLAILHSRSEFEDWEEPAKKRLMIRMWLDADRNVRPTVPEVNVYQNKGGRGGIDPVPGRVPGDPKFRADDVPERKAVSQ